MTFANHRFDKIPSRGGTRFAMRMLDTFRFVRQDERAEIRRAIFVGSASFSWLRDLYDLLQVSFCIKHVCCSGKCKFWDHWYAIFIYLWINLKQHCCMIVSIPFCSRFYGNHFIRGGFFFVSLRNCINHLSVPSLISMFLIVGFWFVSFFS